MKQPNSWIRSAIVPALLGAVCLAASPVVGAQYTKPPATTAAPADKTTTPPAATTTPPAATTPRAGEDDAVEFTKLDKNKDGMIDKAEAIMEPRLLAEWSKADMNKDGKIDKQEFLSFEQARHTKTK